MVYSQSITADRRSSCNPSCSSHQISDTGIQEKMSSSRAKNFRRRSDSSGDTNGDDKSSPSSIATASRSRTLTQPKSRSQKPDAPKRLSFADDEDEDEGPIAPRAPTRTRPPAAAPVHKLTSAKDRSASSTSATPAVPSNVHPQTGEYTMERLRELQKNARPLGSMPKAQLPPPITEPKTAKAEPVIVLRGLVKPPALPIPGREKGREVVSALQQEVEEEMLDEVEDSGDGENSRLAKLEIGGKGRDSSMIPDQATINAIRAKRERMRQSRGPAPDYISLDGSGVMSTHPSEGGGSSGEEEEDFQGRIALFGDRKDSGAKKGVFEVMDNRVSVVEPRVADVGLGRVEDDDEDDEERKWEEEQLRKAGYRTRIGETSSNRGTSIAQPIASVQPPPSLFTGIAHQASSSNLALGASVGVTRSAEVMSIPKQAEVATRALQENINKLKESHSRTLTSLIRTDENLSESLSEITSLEKSLEAAGEKYIFMQQLRDFISVMCDFLKDKASLIEELEEQMQKLHEVRASTVEERRASYMADEANEVEAAVAAAISVLSKGSGSAFISAATTAAQAAAAAAKESLNLPVQLDEFGRDVNKQKRMDYARRTEERKQRRDRLESKRMMSAVKDKVSKQIEGEVSTDESDSDKDAYQSSRDELLQTAGQIFSDAAVEYSNLSIVKEKFERWQELYSSSYRDAYMSLNVPAIFSPFVRLELLKWDPLYSKTIFENMEWYKILLDYGLAGENKNITSDDVDDNLIPELVEKVALPILHHEIEHCWDILSTRRTENAVFATEMVTSYIPPSSKALHELLAVVRGHLTKAITSFNVPIWSSTVTKTVPGAAQYAAYRFGMSIRLLRNICLWKDILPLPVLEKLALEDLLIVKLLPHVRSSMSSIHDAITRMERIVASLSGVWFGPNITVDHSLKLKPLVECVAEIGRKLEKRHAAGVSEEETLGLARRLKTMLVQLNEYDKARAMLRTFQLKEAL